MNWKTTCLAAGGLLLTWAGVVQTQSILQTPVAAETLKSRSLSETRVEGNKTPISIFLFADNQKAETLRDPFCGGDKGAKQYSGNYHLLSLQGNEIVSDIDLGKDYWFVEGRPHDGLHEFVEPKTGGELIGIYQYRGCNAERVEFFQVDASGVIDQVPFSNEDGSENESVWTGPGGDVPLSREGEFIFCSYSNFVGYQFCDSYIFKSNRFEQTNSWMTQAAGVARLRPRVADEARRSLYDFLSALANKKYQEAAFYYGGSYESSGPTDLGALPDEKSELLEAFCTTRGGKCFVPEVISDKQTGPTEMLFSVSLVTRDLDPIVVGKDKEFDFRVRRVGDSFKVLDLPPR